MQLLFIRHAIAVDRDAFAETGKDDDLRPLTADGRRKMRKIAKALQHMLGCPERLVTSPLTRAEQTAEILADVYGMKISETLDALRPGSRVTLFAPWASEQPVDATIAIVGHEPNLSKLVSWLMTGDTESHVALKKGGACLLSFGGAPHRGGAMLEWLLTPAQLRQMGD